MEYDAFEDSVRRVGGGDIEDEDIVTAGIFDVLFLEAELAVEAEDGVAV